MKIYFSIVFFLTANLLFSQSYAPPAGQVGSTAIPADSSMFVEWAIDCITTRGLQDIAVPGGLFSSAGTNNNAIGTADGSVVCLGDRGNAILTFDNPIANGSGFDFAVFENGFSDGFLELAFVEVSSDGVHFFRFPSHSETQSDKQVDGFGNLDCRYLNNLAGKYRVNFGTPFDLSDLLDDVLLNKNRITHIKIIDVVGSIDSTYASYDSFGNSINDPYPTPFPSSGFDLDAVGVIHQSLGLNHFGNDFGFKLYPNPIKNTLNIEGNSEAGIDFYDVMSKLIYRVNLSIGINSIDVSTFKPGVYFVKLRHDLNSKVYKIIIE
jgi:hypothetical protein